MSKNYSGKLIHLAICVTLILLGGPAFGAAGDPTDTEFTATLPPAIAVGVDGKAPYLNDKCDEIEAWVKAYQICLERYSSYDPDRVAPYSWSVNESCEISDVECYTVSCGEASRPDGLTTENGTIIYAPGTEYNPTPINEDLATRLGEGMNDSVEESRRWRQAWWDWLWGNSENSPEDTDEDDETDETDEDEQPEDGFLPDDGGCFPFPTGW